MSQEQYNTKKREFKHLSVQKRAQLEILLKQKMSKTQIAKELGISRSTVYEEIKRGSVQQMDGELRVYTRYFADAGQRVYKKNRSNSRNPLRAVKAAAFLEYAEKSILYDKLSPDAVCGKARRLGLFEDMVCTKTLYNYIDQCILKVRNIDLPLRVKRATKRKEARRTRRQYGNSIEIRPTEVLSREEFGHWEIDTVIGTANGGDVFLTIDERKTRQRLIEKIPSRTAAAVREGLSRIIQRESLPLAAFKSITADNGSEFAHVALDYPDIPVYFAHPYSAWERGTNENQNGLLRRFFPKGRSLANVPESAVLRAQNWINNLPRKLFDYSTSAQLFSLCLANLECPI